MKKFRLAEKNFGLFLYITLVLNSANLFSQVIEVENMPIKTVGQPISGGWLLDVEGLVADTINFATDGYYSFTIRAKGAKYDNEWPFMEAAIDDLICGPVVVDKNIWQNYTIYSKVNFGMHQLSLSYINDLASRSLYLDNVTVKAIAIDEEAWLILLAQSIMSRFPDPASYSITSWQFEELMWGIAKTYEITGNIDYLNYVKTYLNDHVDNEGNLDCGATDLIPGVLLVWLYQKTGEEKFLLAANQVGEYMLNEYPRTSEGGYVHLEDLVDQLWDDTLGGVGRFLGMMGFVTGDNRYFDEGVNQFIVHANHLQNPASGLFYHAWDEDGSADWSLLPNHCSPCYWARGNGWVIRGLTEFIEFLPPAHPGRSALAAILENLVSGLSQYQDSLSGLWYTVIDRGGDGINYLETSGTTLIAYGMQKAINLGCLSANYQQNVDRANEGIFRKIYKKENNEIIVTGVSAGTGPGDYDNYVYKPIRTGDDYPYGDGVFLQEKSEIVKHGPLTTNQISGKVLYYSNNNAIKDVLLSLSGGQSLTIETGTDGYYCFPNLPPNMDYMISPNKLADSDFGLTDITTYDAALTARAAVGILDLSEMQEIAADVNRDGNIYAFDAALIAQYSVGLPKLPASFVGEWIFLPGNYSYSNLASDQLNQDFTGILLGNVHGNWAPQNSPYASAYSLKKYGKLSDIQIEPGSLFEIPIEMPDENDIISLNIQFRFDPDVMKFYNLAGTGLNKDARLFYNVSGNIIKIGIYDIYPFVKDKEILRLKFKATKIKNQIGKFSIDRYLLNEQLLMTAEAHIFVGAQHDQLPDKFSLSQNYPNPFNAGFGGTTINFEIPKQTNVKISVYNSLGQLVCSFLNKELPTGSYNIKWDGRNEHGEILSSGIYFYRLITDEHVLLRKLLLLR